MKDVFIYSINVTPQKEDTKYKPIKCHVQARTPKEAKDGIVKHLQKCSDFDGRFVVTMIKRIKTDVIFSTLV